MPRRVNAREVLPLTRALWGNELLARIEGDWQAPGNNRNLLEFQALQGDDHQVLMKSPIGIFKILPGPGSEDSPQIEVIFRGSNIGRFSFGAIEAAGGGRLLIITERP